MTEDLKLQFEVYYYQLQILLEMHGQIIYPVFFLGVLPLCFMGLQKIKKAYQDADSFVKKILKALFAFSIIILVFISFLAIVSLYKSV